MGRQTEKGYILDGNDEKIYDKRNAPTSVNPSQPLIGMNRPKQSIKRSQRSRVDKEERLQHHAYRNARKAIEADS